MERSIRNTLPPSCGFRNDCLKRFPVRLKEHPELAGQPVELIRPHVEQWHHGAWPRIRTKSFLKATWRETQALWQKTDPRKQAIERVAAAAFREEPPPFVYQRKYKPPLIKLVLLCRALQLVWGTEPFPLDCRRAGDLIGVSKSTASKYFGELEGDVLQRVRKGSYRQGLASEWRYLHAVDK